MGHYECRRCDQRYDKCQCAAIPKAVPTCNTCGKALGKSWVSSSFGSWHIECAPPELLITKKDHYP